MRVMLTDFEVFALTDRRLHVLPKPFNLLILVMEKLAGLKPE